MNMNIAAGILTLLVAACATNDSTPAQVTRENAMTQKGYSYDEHIIQEARNRLEVLGHK